MSHWSNLSDISDLQEPKRTWFNDAPTANDTGLNRPTYTVDCCLSLEAPWRVWSQCWQYHAIVSCQHCRAFCLKFLRLPLESLEVAKKKKKECLRQFCSSVTWRLKIGWRFGPVRLFRSSSLVPWPVLLSKLAITNRANFFSKSEWPRMMRRLSRWILDTVFKAISTYPPTSSIDCRKNRQNKIWENNSQNFDFFYYLVFKSLL